VLLSVGRWQQPMRCSILCGFHGRSKLTAREQN
jgi:hypothetical protein